MYAHTPVRRVAPPSPLGSDWRVRLCTRIPKVEGTGGVSTRTNLAKSAFAQHSAHGPSVAKHTPVLHSHLMSL